MNKAILTIVVTGTTCETVLSELKDAMIGNVKVLAEGDVRVSYKDLATLPNEFWLHEADVSTEQRLCVVAHGTDTTGRELTVEEMDVLKQYGVCVEFRAIFPDAQKYGSPLYAVHAEVAEAEASRYGFSIAGEDFVVNVNAGDDGSEQRWLRIAMPAWFNLSL